MFVVLSSMANADAGSLPSVVCGEEVTETAEQLCLLRGIADGESLIAGPAAVFVADAGPIVAVVLTAVLGFRMGRGL
jgi:hypothetical protein